MNKKILETFEEQFPKGKCKERGQALVLHSIAQIEIKNIFKDIDEVIKKTESPIPIKIGESKFIKGLIKIKKKYSNEF